MTWGRTVVALGLLTGNLVRRLLRQGIIIRSMTFPVILVIGTLVLTVSILAWVSGPETVVVGPSVPDPVMSELQARGWRVERGDNPGSAVQEGRALAGVEARSFYISGPSLPTRSLEADLREAMGTRWRLSPVPRRPSQVDRRALGAMVSLLALLFSLYGVVFGAGMVARDRDDGTLEAELALPVPRWIHGATRWLAGGGVLAVFFWVTVAVLDAFLGIDQAAAMVRHGAASGAAAVGVGLAVIGRGGLKQGFSGPLAAGLTVVTGLIAGGTAMPDAVARWVPMSSLWSSGSGWEALLGAAAVGVLSVTMFTWRAARG